MEKKDWIGRIIKDFENIEKLVETPNFFKDFAINILKGVDDRMATNTEKKKIENGIEALENISKEAIKENFDINIIYNQMCVLAVSTLSAWIEDQFKDCFFDEKIVKNYEKADIKITIKELSEKYNFEIKEKMGEILLEKDQDINFQDLQSILRTYKKYFEHEIAIKEECKNHIILYQQIRHALVHTGGTIDARFLSLVAKGGVCTEYKVGEKIALGKEDWTKIKTSFLAIADAITDIGLN